jgi:hypothetical protein
MLKRVVCVLAALAALVAVSPVAGAAAKKHKAKNHSVTATVKNVSVEQTGNPPLSGTSTNAGLVTSSLGNGAITGTTTYAAPNFSSTETVFLAHGTFKGTLKGTGTLNPDGSISFSGTGKVTGGTDSYKGAKGSVTFTGSEPKNSNVATFNVTGKVKY